MPCKSRCGWGHSRLACGPHLSGSQRFGFLVSFDIWCARWADGGAGGKNPGIAFHPQRISHPRQKQLKLHRVVGFLFGLGWVQSDSHKAVCVDVKIWGEAGWGDWKPEDASCNLTYRTTPRTRNTANLWLARDGRGEVGGMCRNQKKLADVYLTYNPPPETRSKADAN